MLQRNFAKYMAIGLTLLTISQTHSIRAADSSTPAGSDSSSMSSELLATNETPLESPVVSEHFYTDESYYDVNDDDYVLEGEHRRPASASVTSGTVDLAPSRDDVDSEGDGSEEDENPEWDLLIFTQQWPVTTCYHWREEDKNHGCSLPTQKEFWTIHGIWPTKLGHFGPNFCNKSAEFDLNQLTHIVDRLKEFWPDIDGDTTYDWLWKHEWLKHGTCAALLADLDNELKYFRKGLDWRDKYLMSNLLGSSGIHPDSNNTVIALQTALVKSLGKNPSIHCLYDGKNDISYLAEIRICFDKSLQLTDCDGVKRGDAVRLGYPGGTVITNCHISKPVHYPSLVPPVQRAKKQEWKFPVVNLYKLVQFIMWFTL